jgi:hypothetical protein
MENPINFQEIRKELLELYKEFLENPEDKALNKEITLYELKYGGLSSYNDYLKSQPIPKDIEEALNGLSTMYQYGLFEDDHKAFSNDKIISNAKEILEKLSK